MLFPSDLAGLVPEPDLSDVGLRACHCQQNDVAAAVGNRQTVVRNLSFEQPGKRREPAADIPVDGIAKERIDADFVDPFGRIRQVKHDRAVKVATVELQQKVGVLLGQTNP